VGRSVRPSPEAFSGYGNFVFITNIMQLKSILVEITWIVNPAIINVYFLPSPWYGYEEKWTHKFFPELFVSLK
jgi:hypothetical protein